MVLWLGREDEASILRSKELLRGGGIKQSRKGGNDRGGRGKTGIYAKGTGKLLREEGSNCIFEARLLGANPSAPNRC